MNASDNKNVLCRNRRLRKSELSHEEGRVENAAVGSAPILACGHISSAENCCKFWRNCNVLHLPSLAGSLSAGHGGIILLVAPFKELINATRGIFFFLVIMLVLFQVRLYPILNVLLQIRCWKRLMWCQPEPKMFSAEGRAGKDKSYPETRVLNGSFMPKWPQKRRI